MIVHYLGRMLVKRGVDLYPFLAWTMRLTRHRLVAIQVVVIVGLTCLTQLLYLAYPGWFGNPEMKWNHCTDCRVDAEVDGGRETDDWEFPRGPQQQLLSAPGHAHVPHEPSRLPQILH